LTSEYAFEQDLKVVLVILPSADWLPQCACLYELEYRRNTKTIQGPNQLF